VLPQTPSRYNWKGPPGKERRGRGGSGERKLGGDRKGRGGLGG